MPYTLQNWNTLISNTLHPSNIELFSHNEESIKIFADQSREELERVRTLLIESVLDRSKIKDKQHYVKLNQGMLIRLLDKLYAYRQKQGINDKVLHLYDVIIKHLESTLDFIEDFFSNYFDRNEKVPIGYLTVSIGELSKQLEILKKKALASDPSVQSLVNILASHFNSFCNKRKTSATYNDLMYQKDLMHELLKRNVLGSESSIEDILFYFNYNDDSYVAYLYKKLTAVINNLPGKKDKIETLRFEQKRMNQIITKPHFAFSYAMPSLKEQINHWIEEEVRFLERDHGHLVTNDSGLHVSKPEVCVQVPFKGSEIYLLGKAFIDAGGAPGETYKSLFEKTGSHLSNKNQKGFSPESLRKAVIKLIMKPGKM